MRCKLNIFLLVLLCVDFVLSSQAFTQENGDPSLSSMPKRLAMVQAVMCEGIKENTHQNQAITFSLKLGKVICFTSFDPVPEKTFIYHNWFHRDKLNTRIRLSLQPPRWSTFSRIQLRETDKGPWRVEIADQQGNLLHVLRFSIVD